MVRLWDARARGCWKLRGLSGLAVERTMLVFATEQQACFDWAIDVTDKSDDPLVFEGFDYHWRATEECLGSFLRGIILLHTSTCLRNWEGGSEAECERVERFVESWTHIPFRPLCTKLDFYVNGSSVLRCDWSEDSALVFAGGRDEQELEEHMAALGIELPDPWPDDVL